MNGCVDGWMDKRMQAKNKILFSPFPLQEKVKPDQPDERKNVNVLK